MTVPAALHSFFERSRIALTLSDVRQDDHPLILFNQAFCDLTGYERDEILNRNCRFLQGPKTSESARAEIRTAIEAGIDTQVLLTNYTKEGREFENLLFFYTLRDSASEPLYFMGSQFEISKLATVETLDDHIKTLDQGIVELLSSVQFEKLRTRRILSDAAAGAVRAHLIRRELAG